MNMEKPIIAFMYDFDKTLSTTDMQNYSFIPNLGMTPDEFWNATGEFSKENEVERVLSYMYMMIKKCKDAGIPITREYLRECGKNIKFFKWRNNISKIFTREYFFWGCISKIYIFIILTYMHSRIHF